MAVYADAHLTVDFEKQSVRLDGRRLTLTRKEYELIAFLIQYAGEVVPRATLLHSVWGYGDAIRTRTLDVHIARLRGRLGCYSSEYIHTVFRGGYRFQPCVEPKAMCAASTERLPVAV
jgi:DNA-binding response OmpR family regulator